ncbi:MAG: hypothetical protein ACI857_000011 [Arenicella sp.]|jgi:hypothetical protein
MKRILIIALLAFTTPTVMASQTENMTKENTADAKPISADDFSNVMDVMRGRSSEEMKLKAALKGLKKGVMSIDQISEVMDYMQAEESKLEFAKQAYTQCAEKEAFREVVDEKFSDAESLKALSEFIETK